MDIAERHKLYIETDSSEMQQHIFSTSSKAQHSAAASQFLITHQIFDILFMGSGLILTIPQKKYVAVKKGMGNEGKLLYCKLMETKNGYTGLNHTKSNPLMSRSEHKYYQ